MVIVATGRRGGSYPFPTLVLGEAGKLTARSNSLPDLAAHSSCNTWIAFGALFQFETMTSNAPLLWLPPIHYLDSGRRAQ